MFGHHVPIRFFPERGILENISSTQVIHSKGIEGISPNLSPQRENSLLIQDKISNEISQLTRSVAIRMNAALPFVPSIPAIIQLLWPCQFVIFAPTLISAVTMV